MLKVRFIRDTDPSREGGPGYKAGAVVTLKVASARHWEIRGAAVRADENDQSTNTPVVEQDELEALIGDAGKTPETADEPAVEDPADVAGENGSDSGNGAEPDTTASAAGRRGKAAKAGN